MAVVSAIMGNAYVCLKKSQHSNRTSSALAAGTGKAGSKCLALNSTFMWSPWGQDLGIVVMCQTEGHPLTLF